MRRPTRSSWVATGAAVATLMVVGAAVFGSATAGPHARPTYSAAAAIGGPATTHAIWTRYESPTNPYSGLTRDIQCDQGSRPETLQGKTPKADYASGRAAKGYFCNARMIAHYGRTGGYRVERYVDQAGHECAYWDSTLLWPHNVPDQGPEGPGVYVMDMHHPAHPIHTDTLRTPAMQSPHESLRLNVKRGLLVADMGYPSFNPGFVDV